MTKWIEDFRHQYNDALPEAKKFEITSPTKCAEAVAFKEAVNAMALELMVECDTMLDELREASQLLEQKIDTYRRPVLVKPKATKKEIG